MSVQAFRAGRVIGWAVLLVGLAAAALLFIAFFQQMPIEGTTLAIDWGGIWHAIQGGQPNYLGGETGVRIPPWNLLLILPLGLLPMRAGWGALVFLTYVVLVLSVPRTPRRALFFLSVFLLTTSFLALRHAADGNFEAMIIAGALLCVHGYRRRNAYTLAAGILLVCAKPQESALLLFVLALSVLRTWPRPAWLQLGGLLALVIVPGLLWKGGDWLTAVFGIYQRGSVMDISLWATLERAGIASLTIRAGVGMAFLAATLYWAWKSGPTFSRAKAAMLISASLLLAPYSAGNSILTVLAVGIIPLFQERPRIGGLLILLIDLPFLATRELLYWGQGYYWPAFLLLVWALMIVWMRQEDAATTIPVDSQARQNGRAAV